MAKQQNAIAAYQEQLKKELETVNERIAPPSGNRISTKGKVFTLPDGKQNPGPMKAIILDWRATSLWYDGVYDPANPRPPQCFSIAKVIEGMKPSEASPQKQAEECASCPLNQWGSATTGKGKACKNGRRLALIPTDANEETTPLILEVSPTGIGNFEGYVNRLTSQMGLLPIQVITDIGFVEADAFPKLTFGNPQPNKNLHVAMVLRETAQALLDQEPKQN